MAIPVSLAENKSINLPLQHGPFHVHLTIPFSLLVRDFDPTTTPLPKMERSQSWLTILFCGRRYDAPIDAMTKAVTVASPIFRRDVWPTLSVLLFGKEKPIMYSYLGSDAEDWARAGASTISWAFCTGVTEEDMNDAKAVILKAGLDSSCESTGGIRFTVGEMSGSEKAAWKRAWLDSPRYRTRDESEIDEAMNRRNDALYRLTAGSVPQSSSEKGVVSDSD